LAGKIEKNGVDKKRNVNTNPRETKAGDNPKRSVVNLKNKWEKTKNAWLDYGKKKDAAVPTRKR